MNATFHRAVFVLEANVGFVQIRRHLQRADTAGNAAGDAAAFGDGGVEGGELDVTAMQRSLRDLVFQRLGTFLLRS